VIKVSREVRAGAARLSVTVRADSIRRAVNFVAERYPKGDVRVRFPIDPERFFVEDATAPAGMVGVELPEKVAA
jgi:hypothetical protein